MNARLSIVVPVLNEAAIIERALAALQPYRRQGVEVIVADGGSSDGTRDLAKPYADKIVCAPRGRALQMNAGAAEATGSIVLFLHADSVLPPSAPALICEYLQSSGRQWGRFDVAIEGAHPLLRVIAFMMNLRSRITGIATGDQGIFVTRELFAKLGGFPALPLMEDIAFSQFARRSGRPACAREKIVTSGRRWEKHGVWRTITLMWRLRLAYFFGADPARLAARYYGGATHE